MTQNREIGALLPQSLQFARANAGNELDAAFRRDLRAVECSQEVHKTVTEKKTTLKPSREASGDPKEWARRARELSEKLAASGRRFSDSTEAIRADRDSRV